MQNPSDRLTKLLPLLGSDRPGEVAAAAGAIGRLLTGQGKDWHDLAKAAGSVFGQAIPSPMEALSEELRRAAEAATRDTAAWRAETAARTAKREAEERAREEWEAQKRAWREEQEAAAAAEEERERQRWEALTPEEQAAEIEAERAAEESRKAYQREVRRRQREERKAREEAKREAMGAEILDQANRMRLREKVRWLLDQWGDRPQETDWHYLARAAEAARIGAWAKFSHHRVEEIRQRVRPDPEPEKPRRKRRTASTA